MLDWVFRMASTVVISFKSETIGKGKIFILKHRTFWGFYAISKPSSVPRVKKTTCFLH